MTVDDIKNLIISVAGATSAVVTIIITAIVTAYNVYKRLDAQGKIPSVISRKKYSTQPIKRVITLEDLEARIISIEETQKTHERKLAQTEGSISFFRNRIREIPISPGKE